ncbi:cytochrome C oxidase Cbb3 [Parashewanella curva]|uniref:Cytochrome C oxidase Cbb3 n=1 Tax=Parashewanella curva TaxID=2338552 RepID=A0A3L8PS17_9GAMM|nr:FixH family protein [Parashewanella curva]RLV58191.1 cytochrome C oxidase Cbb3 [Parashewanella curva]
METPTAWYKQFWPWFLIILPLTVVAASIATLVIAAKYSDTVVVDDYYKKGKGINQDKKREQKARAMGLQFSIQVHNNEILIQQHGGTPYKAALAVEFYHPTIKERDFDVLASADGNSVYRIDSKQPLNGDWIVQVEGFDKSWRLKKRITLKDGTESWLN